MIVLGRGETEQHSGPMAQKGNAPTDVNAWLVVLCE